MKHHKPISSIIGRILIILLMFGFIGALSWFMLQILGVHINDIILQWPSLL